MVKFRYQFPKIYITN